MELTQQEKELFRDSVGQFLDRRVKPHYEEWEQAGIWPRELWNQLGENGFLCVDQDESSGGAGAEFELSSIIVHEIARHGYLALAAAVSVHSDIVAPYIAHLGTEEQRRSWLPRMATGQAVGAIGMTEPGAGSDLQNLRTRAQAEGDDFVIDGNKTFITNGQHCDVMITATKTDPSLGARGITLFLVDCALQGFVRGRNLEKIGLASGDTSELSLQDVRVPATAKLGGNGEGFAHLMNELPRDRLILAVGAVGAAVGILEMTVDYVHSRQAFGSELAKFQNTRYRMAELATEIELNRALVEKSITSYQRGELTPARASMCKLASTEIQGRVADQCLQLFGGYGYMKEYPISRAFVDARVQRIYGGTSEIMKELIAREVLGG